ncbi:hypothetical protein SH661x_002351 [Planctomicrobium sp. SH661]|uniref:hypothetical protein n=1 Tax=Planctomicrobium sp. SH661 TaxID=3448124 RepID=UPI003F5BE023
MVRKKMLLLILLSGVLLEMGERRLLSAAEVAPASFDEEVAAFELADQSHLPTPGQILLLGGTKIRSWDTQAAFPGLDLLKHGFSELSIEDLAANFDRIIAPYHPRQVVIQFGIGDESTPQQNVDDFKNLVTRLHEALPTTPLVCIGISPHSKSPQQAALILETNSQIKAICETDPLQTFLDLDAPTRNAQGAPREELFDANGQYLSPEGYALWASLLRPHLVPDQRAVRFRSIGDAYHPWTPPETLEEWKQVSQRLREQVLVACGLWPMPAKEELKPVIHGLVDRGDYTVERVYFASLPGFYVTGSLYRPKGKPGKLPAVLNPHGHWSNGRFMENNSDMVQHLIKLGAEQFEAGATSHLQARMVQLTRMGCVVFHYDTIGVADNGPLPHRGGLSDTDASLWLHNHLGLQNWNSIRALDFVTSLPDVDPNRIGITGASGGGTQTFLLTAVDPRVTAAFPAVMVSTAMQGGCICENADYLRVGVNNIALAGLFAPKPMAMSGAKDWTVNIETLGYPELRKIYSLYGAEDLVYAKTFPQFGHNFNQVSREVMYDWFNKHLDLGLPTPVRQTDFTLLTRDEMTVFNGEHPRPADSLNEKDLRASLRARDRKTFEDILAGPSERYQEVIGTACRVMLPPNDGLITIEPFTETHPEVAGGSVRNFVALSGNARVPVTLASPQPSLANGRVVLWLDGAGRAHLRGADGKFTPEVLQLLSAGFYVCSADLFLTGNYAGCKDRYEVRMRTPSPSHESDPVDVEYTGFLYGYNHTLLAERIRDIQAVEKSLQSLGFSTVTLVGTGDAGVWALLSRAQSSNTQIDLVLADLNGFSFGGLKTNTSAEMLPGALKYGGVGGLSALAYPLPLTIHGATDSNLHELTPLSIRYQQSQENLKLTSLPLSRADVVKVLTKK